MPMPKITKSFVDTIPPAGKGEQKFYRDDEVKGFGLRVTAGSKTHIVEGRVHGSGVNRRITLGKHGKLTPELACPACNEALINAGASVVTGKGAVFPLH